jgi:predicted GNAT family acetyltransferase
MLGLLQSTPRAAALGIVYTPPEHRGQKYATSAVAALNAELLARGLERRYFFIDPANRAAQALSRKIGCELVQAAVDIDFR